MAGRFHGRRALVTGGGTGIGAAIARRIADEGGDVVITGRSETELAAQSLPFVVADLTSAEDRARLVDQVGEVDVLVNDAGVHSGDWDLSLAVHLEAPRALVAGLRDGLAARRGNVVTVSAVAALVSTPVDGAYQVSKAAQVALTRFLAVDLGPRGIRVNAVLPGWTRTPMADGDMRALMDRHGVDLDGAYAIATAAVPLRRPARPEDVAAAVAFLASDDAAMITGVSLLVDGGHTAVNMGGLAFAGGSALPAQDTA